MNHTSSSLFLLRALLLSCAFGFACAQYLDGSGSGQEFLMPALNINSFLNTCRNKKGPSTAAVVKDELQKAGTCIVQTLSTTLDRTDGSLGQILRGSSESTNTSAVLISVIPSVCNDFLRPIIKNCFPPLINGLKRCYDAEGSRFIESQGQVVSQVFKYLCQNKGKRIIKFFTEGGPECVEQILLISGQQCTNKIPKNLNLESFLENPATTCKTQKYVGQCLVPKFRQCNSASSAVKVILRRFVGILMNKAYCSSITNKANAADPRENFEEAEEDLADLMLMRSSLY